MNKNIKNYIKLTLSPLYCLYSRCLSFIGKRYPQIIADMLYHRVSGRYIDWDNPKDLNEKINWLKLHEDPAVWASLSDKYRVRDYVSACGYEDILVPLYGKWDCIEDFFNDFDQLPEEFVLKSNNGCGHVIIVNEANGGKQALDRNQLRKTLSGWLREKEFGLNTAQLHYQLIDNCIMAEMLLKDKSIATISSSMIDYKIWCFHGVPAGCQVTYNRTPCNMSHMVDYYDCEWKEHSEYLRHASARQVLPKPIGWDRMLMIASVLSKGHPQVRVDLYNIDGRIYFGELTFTAAGGYISSLNQPHLLEMGSLIHLDLSQPKNRFARGQSCKE